MSDNIEQRLAELERRYLALEASSVFEVQAVGTLVALIEHGAAEPFRSQVRPLYAKMVRQATEEFLRTQADDAPNLVAQLRHILRHQLDGPPPPP